MAVSVKFEILSEILISQGKDPLFEFVKKEFSLSAEDMDLYKPQINQFVINHNLRWLKKSKGRKSHFCKQYGDWLEQMFVLKPPAPKRPLKPLDQCSRRTKKRRLEAEEEAQSKK